MVVVGFGASGLGKKGKKEGGKVTLGGESVSKVRWTEKGRDLSRPLARTYVEGSTPHRTCVCIFSHTDTVGRAGLPLSSPSPSLFIPNFLPSLSKASHSQ